MTDALQWVRWRFDRWRGDEGLRMCGLAARGLWIELLAIMHNSDPYGHLAIKGKPPSPKQIASLVGTTTDRQVTALLRELEEAGVFSRSEAGLIYCRRMVRDNAAHVAGKATGRLGGNPALIRTACEKDNGDGKPLPITEGVNPLRYPRGEGERREEKEVARARSPNGNILPGPTKWNDAAIVAAGLDPKKPPDHPDNLQNRDRPTVNGFFLDEAFDTALDLAGIDPAKSRADWQPVIAWLKDGIEPDTINAAIRRCAERTGYQPPRTLVWFNNAVREQKAAA